VDSRLFGVSDLLERGGQSLGYRLVGLGPTAPEASLERYERGWGYKDVERVQVSRFDLSDPLDRLCLDLAGFEDAKGVDH